ncbi:MAG: hypothetical protein ACLFQJ_09925 [Campylobacterales bacterium]
MKGKILFYNSQNGDGIIIGEDKKKYKFSAMEWEDFESLPSPEQTVSMQIENSVVVGVEPIKEEVKNEGSLRSDVPKDIEKITQERAAKQEKTHLNTKSNLKSTLSIEECLDNFFEPVEYLVGDPEEYLGYPKYDYFQMKRFMMTAYNDLKDLDPTLHNDSELKELLEELTSLAKAHESIMQKLSRKKLAFEMVFLRNQPEYVRFIRSKEDSLNRMTVLNRVEESIFPEIRSKEKELRELGDVSFAQKEMLENELKDMKKRYVDAIHESASISEELSSMADLKAIYMEMYFNSFVREFDERAEYYIGVIEESLGVKTFDFDRQLWQKAARSKAVKEYFASANIKGGYSTLTFLSYYLKNLDADKLNDEQRGLMGLLEYLRKKENEKFS